MSIKKILREAEEEIETILQRLQVDHGIKPFRIYIVNDHEAEEIEVTIVKDERY